jgi:hypothetical protein
MIRALLILTLILGGNAASAAKINCPKNQKIYDRIILHTATKYGVDPALVHAVIKQESCYDRKAVSHADAQGLMQLIPATARRFGVVNVFNAKENITGGTKYLAWLLKRFKGNVRFALAGYNAGEGRVDQYKGIPPYRETQNYVVKVMANYRQFKGLNRTPGKRRTYKQIKAQPKIILANVKPKKRVSKKQKLRTTKTRQKVIAKKTKNQEIIDNSPSVRIHSLTIASVSKPQRGYTRIRAKKRGEG